MFEDREQNLMTFKQSPMHEIVANNNIKKSQNKIIALLKIPNNNFTERNSIL